MDKTICELFAGVGGFRLGLERASSDWKTVWFNQWEPGAKTQWAHQCYVRHFGDLKDINGEYHTNDDICSVDKFLIPEHTLLTAGFPCQDYSVAKPLSSSKGIEGKKGVLWWEIYKTLEEKNPAFCLFENVDRLLKSPAGQRGRDFGVILSCLLNLGYSAEWRVVNASDYGAGQKRKRVFIFAYKNNTDYSESLLGMHEKSILEKEGFMAKTFPVLEAGEIKEVKLSGDAYEVSENFSFNFEKAGYLRDGKIYTADIKEKKEGFITLGEILEKDVGEKYYVNDDDKLEKWKYLKGSKKIPRISKDGHEYIYSEGAMAFPDDLNKPGRTMLTSEGTINRSSHIIKDPQNGRFRIITPIEAERLHGFDDNWTDTGMPERMRYFCMGNALVVPMITRMGEILNKIIEEE